MNTISSIHEQPRIEPGVVRTALGKAILSWRWLCHLLRRLPRRHEDPARRVGGPDRHESALQHWEGVRTTTSPRRVPWVVPKLAARNLPPVQTRRGLLA